MIFKIFKTNYTKYICPKFQIKPLEIYSYEHGIKISILRKQKKYNVIGFAEDRKAALEEVINDKLTSNIPCFFADWGYNLKEDQINLNDKISIISLKTLKKILSL